jgi:hypothetical protein
MDGTERTTDTTSTVGLNHDESALCLQNLFYQNGLTTSKQKKAGRKPARLERQLQ